MESYLDQRYFAVPAGYTTADVTWSGGGGTAAPSWTNGANWSGGLSPVTSSYATVNYNATGGNVTGVLEAARGIGKLNITEVSANHAVDLGGYSLSVTGIDCQILGLFSVSNGTLRLGTPEREADLLMGAPWSPSVTTLRLLPGSTLDPFRINLIRVGVLPPSHINNGNARLDLRGVIITGGALKARNVRIQATYRSTYSYLAIDSTTTLNTLVVSNELTVGEGAYGGTSYIGNPADSGFRLPVGLSLRVGESSSQRGSLQVGKYSSAANALTAILAASTGGTFTAYLSALKVAPYESGCSGDSVMKGQLDLSGMDSCSVDSQTILVAPNYSVNTLAKPSGDLRFGPGAVTAGTVEIGAGSGLGYGILHLSNTMFTVTNSFKIAATGVITNFLGGQPKGLDVDGAFIDGGGKIRVVFAEAPVAATNWAIRIKGNAQSTLHGMVGAGRLTSTGVYSGKKAGILYDAAAGYTYYAMADSSAFVSVPQAVAYTERTFEMEPAGTVRIHVNEVNNGSYDPDGRTPVALSVSSDGTTFATNASLTAFGDHPVVLKIEVGDPVAASAVSTCTVHVVALHAGVQSNLTWLGAASTVLMDRREWWWKGSWLQGVPPANPTTGTITFAQYGMSVTGRLEQSRQIGGLTTTDLVNNHRLNLGGNMLTVAGTLLHGLYGTLELTNGTLRIGTDTTLGSLVFGGSSGTDTPSTLLLRSGMTFDGRRVNLIHFVYNSGSHVNNQNSRLDLRGVTLAGGVLGASNMWLTVNYRNADGSYIALNETTTISAIAVTNELYIGRGRAGGQIYMGNPADPARRLPPNVSLRVGVSPMQRGYLEVGSLSEGSATSSNILAASSGGSMIAYLTDLIVMKYTGTGTAQLNGIVDLAAMDSCLIDTTNMTVAVNEAGTAAGNPRGLLRLPPGWLTTSLASIGATNGVGFGRVETSNTVFTVTNTLTINKTGQLILGIGSQSAGLVISNAMDTALVMATATNNALRIVFKAKPSQLPLNGLGWAGDHVDALKALQAAGRLVVDSSGLAPRTAEIYKHGGFTFVGLPPPRGTIILVR